MWTATPLPRDLVVARCRRELELSLPGVFADLDKHIYNLQKNECGILIAGVLGRFAAHGSRVASSASH